MSGSKCGRLLSPPIVEVAQPTANFLTYSLPAVNTVNAEERLPLWQPSALLATPKRVILGSPRPVSGRGGYRRGEMAMKVTGRCHCGQISFEAEIDPTQVRICHCTDCQTLTGTAFRTNVSSLPGTFVLKSGTPKTYIKTAESGNKRAHGFCPECGTPLYSTAPGPNPMSYGLRVGALDRRAELRPTRQGWCRSALPWSMDISGVERFERQP